MDVPSPELLIVKVPEAVEVYPYVPQPSGPVGTVDMKGPPDCPCVLVTTVVS